MLQRALSAAGVQAQRIEWLWWVMLITTSIVTVIVLAMLVVALVKAKRRGADQQLPSGDATLLHAIGWSTAATVIILFGLLIASIVTSRAIASQYDATAMIIEVTANQWWWNVEYQHPEPEQRVRTANELHIPVGRTVAIKLLSADVIHSFWVPSLHGKMDAIPGHSSVLWVRVDTPGVYRGQCAEYCGVQHAKMAMLVIAEPADQFERWIQEQRTTARPPENDIQARGLQLVQSGTCVMCHTIRGTIAGARRAPDLTHVASRMTIASGTLPFSRQHVEQWIADPQRFKPGTRMPEIALTADDRSAIAAYLEHLR